MNLDRFKWDFSFILSIPKQVYTITAYYKFTSFIACDIFMLEIHIITAERKINGKKIYDAGYSESS